MQPHSQAGIHSIAEYLPAHVASIDDLHNGGLLRGSPETLKSFGFETVRLVEDGSLLEAGLNVSASLAAGMAACVAGWSLASAVF